MNETKTGNFSLSVVMPVFNEELIIKESILSLNEILKDNIADYEIIAVNDGSTDKTAQILGDLSTSIKKLRVKHIAKNSDMGNALREGFKDTTKDLILYTDADMPFDYNLIIKAEELLISTRSDIISGYRQGRLMESWIRALTSLCYNLIIKCLFGVNIKDINSPFKIMRRSMLQALKLSSTGSFITAEIMIKAYYQGYIINQIPAPYHARKYGKSKLFNAYTIIKALTEMMRCRKTIKTK